LQFLNCLFTCCCFYTRVCISFVGTNLKKHALLYIYSVWLRLMDYDSNSILFACHARLKISWCQLRAGKAAGTKKIIPAAQDRTACHPNINTRAARTNTHESCSQSFNHPALTKADTEAPENTEINNSPRHEKILTTLTLQTGTMEKELKNYRGLFLIQINFRIYIYDIYIQNIKNLPNIVGW